jgi:hypothetical protein
LFAIPVKTVVSRSNEASAAATRCEQTTVLLQAKYREQLHYLPANIASTVRVSGFSSTWPLLQVHVLHVCGWQHAKMMRTVFMTQLEQWSGSSTFGHGWPVF